MLEVMVHAYNTNTWAKEEDCHRFVIIYVVSTSLAGAIKQDPVSKTKTKHTHTQDLCETNRSNWINTGRVAGRWRNT